MRIYEQGICFLGVSSNHMYIVFCFVFAIYDWLACVKGV